MLLVRARDVANIPNGACCQAAFSHLGNIKYFVSTDGNIKDGGQIPRITRTVTNYSV